MAVDDRFQQQVKDCESTLQSLLLAQSASTVDVLAAQLASQPVATSPYKHALELAFRTTLHSLCTQPPATAPTSPLPSTPLTALLDLAIASTPQLLDATLPFQLLEDAFDYTPLMQLPPLFAFLSSHFASLASPALTQPRPRLSLLKACNGLLRRLSKTEGAEWSGELLELLSRMMAVDERGGLNATGKFHTDNLTTVHSEQTAAGGTSDVDSTVDYTFYRTLWSLQSYFADPAKLKQPDSLSSFLSSLDTVLTSFERSPTSAAAMSTVQSTAAYFPKYLSGSRLMHLQLQDSTFRRHLLTQSLIIFQYVLNPTADAALTLPSLTATAAVGSSGRPSTAGATAAASPSVSGGAGSGSQTSAVKGALVRVLQLLAVKVSDDGRPVTLGSSADKYGEHLLQLLSDELAWMRWKQAKAPTFTRPATPLTAPITLTLTAPATKPTKRTKRSRGAQSEVALMGGAKLSELWTDVLSNEESVRDGARKFAPDMEVKMHELLDEDDEWQLRVQRWKKGQQRREAVKREKEKEGEESKEEEKETDGDAMDEDGADEEEDEPDESELMRKNKQRQWTLLRLLRRFDFPLFQKSDGKLDKVVDELKKRRQQAADKAAKDERESERTKAEEAKETTKEAADGAEATAVTVVDEESGTRTEAEKDGDGERMETGADEMAAGDEAAIELERKSEPADETGGKEAEGTEERVEVEREEEEEEEREQARSSRRGQIRDDDSPRAGEKRRSGTGGSDDDSGDSGSGETGESGKRQRVEDEADAQTSVGGEQTDRAAETTEGGGTAETQPSAADSAAATETFSTLSADSTTSSPPPPPPPATAAAAANDDDDTAMQTTQ